MKRTKGIVLAAATVATGLALAGCSTAGGGGGDAADTLTILWEPGQKTGLEPVIEAFKEENPDVDVTVTYAPYNELIATLRTQLTAGTAPDIFYTNPGDGNSNTVRQLDQGGFLADLTDESWVADVPEGIRATWSSDDRVLMYSPSVSSIGAIYNESTLAEVGGTIPETWSEVLELCATAASAGKVAYALGGQTLWVNQGVPLSIAPTLVYLNEPDWDQQRADGETTFADTPGWQEVFDKYEQMLAAGCFNDAPAGTSLEQSVDLVAQHEAVGVMQVAWFIGQFQAATPDDEYTLAALPATDDPSETLLTTASVSGAGVNAKSDNLDLAKQFVSFMTQPEQENIYTTSIGLAIPSIPNDSFDYTDPNAALINDAANADVVVPFVDQGWPNPRVKETMDSSSQGLAATGSPGPMEILQAMDNAWGS